MYWLEPGTTFYHKSSVHFAGLHSLDQPVYFEPDQPALTIVVQQAVQDEMSMVCTGAEAIRSLQLAMKHISYVRLVSLDAVSRLYTYHGVWLITAVDKQSEDQAHLSMPA